MSTIKSSAEDLTLNADGSGNDIIFQSNGSNVATLDQAGTLTATTFTGAATDATKLPLAGGTLTGNTTIATNSTPKLILKRTGNNAGNGYIECHGADDSVDYKIAFAQSNGVMSFDVGGTRMLGVTSDGLCFNSDTAAANALDDYEEGTVATSIANCVPTAAYAKLRYIKVGRVCTVVGQVRIDSNGGGTYAVGGNLPFTSESDGADYRPFSSGSIQPTGMGLDSGYTDLSIIVDPNSSSFGVRQHKLDGSDSVAFRVNQITTAALQMTVSITYVTAS